jgi:chromosome segregation ATPase
MIASLTSQLIESEAAILVSLQLKESEAMIASLTSQLNEFKDKLSLSSSQLNEARNQLSEVQKNYKLLSGDHEALSNTSLEQCDEVILTLTRSQEKLQQRRVSDEPTIFAYHI